MEQIKFFEEMSKLLNMEGLIKQRDSFSMVDHPVSKIIHQIFVDEINKREPK